MSLLSLHDRIWKNKDNRTILLSFGLATFFVLLGFLLILWPRAEEEVIPWYLNQLGLGEITLLDLVGIICLGGFFFFLSIGIASIREALGQTPGFFSLLISGIITSAIGILLLSGWGAILSIVFVLIFTAYIVFSKPTE